MDVLKTLINLLVMYNQMAQLPQAPLQLTLMEASQAGPLITSLPQMASSLTLYTPIPKASPLLISLTQLPMEFQPQPSTLQPPLMEITLLTHSLKIKLEVLQSRLS